MLSKIIINNFFKIGIRTWLKSVCSNIYINSLKLILNKRCFLKVDEIYLEAKNVIYQELSINIIKN